MRHDWTAVHAERFALIAGGQIDSAVSRGRVNCGMSTLARVVGPACRKPMKGPCPKD